MNSDRLQQRSPTAGSWIGDRRSSSALLAEVVQAPSVAAMPTAEPPVLVPGFLCAAYIYQGPLPAKILYFHQHNGEKTISSLFFNNIMARVLSSSICFNNIQTSLADFSPPRFSVRPQWKELNGFIFSDLHFSMGYGKFP